MCSLRSFRRVPEARGNAAFSKIAAQPGAFGKKNKKLGRVEYYGGVALGLREEWDDGLEDDPTI